MSRFVHVLSVGLASLCCFLATPDLASAQNWIEVQSPHFRVVSNRGTRAARQVTLEFERIRAVMGNALRGAVADPLRPLVVVAVGDGGDLVALAPRFQDGPRPGGFFQSGQYMHYIVLRIDQGPATIYHEYFHLLTRLSGSRMPIWLREGLAEFYSNVDLSSSAAKIGQADPEALEYLGRRSLVPLRTLLARTTNPHLDSPDEIRVFYAQSWALTHLLMLGYDDPATGQQVLARYMALVSQGTDSVAAFEQVVGNIEEFDRRLQQYRRQLSFREFVIETGDDINDDAFVTRGLSQTEALALRANVLIEGGEDPDAAGPLLEEAEAFGASSAVLAEANGLFHLYLGREEEAEGRFAEAIQLGSTSYIPYYLQARALEDTAARIERLRQAIVYNPRYAPAYAELARLYANASVFDEAVPLARQAVELNTGEAYYWILFGQILLRMDQPDAARVVAERGRASAPEPEAQKDLTAFEEKVDEYIAARAERERRAARLADPATPNRGDETSESVPPPVDTPQKVRDLLGGDEPTSPESTQQPQGGETRQVSGMWSALECPPGGGLNFVIQAEGVTYVLYDDAPEPIQILDADGAIQEEIFCGPQGRQVIVGFVPSEQSDGAGPVRGTLTELRFP